MAFCTNCGKPVGEKDLFCRNCGASLARTTEEVVPSDLSVEDIAQGELYEGDDVAIWTSPPLKSSAEVLVRDTPLTESLEETSEVGSERVENSVKEIKKSNALNSTPENSVEAMTEESDINEAKITVETSKRVATNTVMAIEAKGKPQKSDKVTTWSDALEDEWQIEVVEPLQATKQEEDLAEWMVDLSPAMADDEEEAFFETSYLPRSRFSRKVKLGISIGALVLFLLGGALFLTNNLGFFAKILPNQQLLSNSSEDASLDQPIVDQDDVASQSSQTLVFQSVSEASIESEESVVTFQEPEAPASPLYVKVKDLFDQTLRTAEGQHALYFVPLTDNQGNALTNEAYVINPGKIHASSLMHLLILVTYYQQVKNGDLTPDQTYSVNSADIVEGVGRLQHQPVGTVYTLNELAELMLIDEDAMATNVLIDYLGGVEKVNDTLQMLGLTQTSVNRKLLGQQLWASDGDNGIDIKEYGDLLVRMYHHQLLGSEYDQAMLQLLHRYEDNTMLASAISREAVPYQLTGRFTAYGVQNDAIVINTTNGAYLLVVLNDGVGDSDEAEAAFTTLMQQFGQQIYESVAH